MNNKLNSRKAQSAMEYLMTYGWAILIIAVVLGALFSLGVFSSSSLLSNVCIASSGYYCGSISFPHQGTTLTVTIGQSTGSSWAANVFAVFAPQATATANGIPNVANGNILTTLNGGTGGNAAIPSGLQVSAPLVSGLTAANTLVGTTTAGSIWIAYGCGVLGTNTFANIPSCSYAQIATLTAKVT